jgi:hypothetical protein
MPGPRLPPFAAHLVACHAVHCRDDPHDRILRDSSPADRNATLRTPTATGNGHAQRGTGGTRATVPELCGSLPDERPSRAWLCGQSGRGTVYYRSRHVPPHGRSTAAPFRRCRRVTTPLAHLVIDASRALLSKTTYNALFPGLQPPRFSSRLPGDCAILGALGFQTLVP